MCDCFEDKHKGEPRLVAAWLIGQNESHKNLIRFLEDTLGVEKGEGKLGDNTLEGLLAAAYLNLEANEKQLAQLPSLEPESAA